MSVLVIDKPSGPTSFAVCKKVQWLFGGRKGIKVGHGGTLDPLASGVLPVCLGEATKLAPFLLEADKAYETTARFGVETDTLDAEGAVVAQWPVQGLTGTEIEAALERFRGSIDQIPPLYSALKREGRPLYEYARAGQEVERLPRRVQIHQFDLVAFLPPHEARFAVRCSKGTYVRSLVADLGRMLGTGAHVTALRRTTSGPFSLHGALSPADLERRMQAGEPLPFVSLASALQHMPACTVSADQEARVMQGKRISLVDLPVAGNPPWRLLRQDGSLLAVGEPGEGGELQTRRVFHPEADDPRSHNLGRQSG